MERKEILGLLRKNILYLEFVKKDGSNREMYCTRDNALIKDRLGKKIDFNRGNLSLVSKRHPHLVHVFDLQEEDVRIVNLKTLDEGSVRVFTDLDEVYIPPILTKKEMELKKKQDAEYLKEKQEFEDEQRALKEQEKKAEDMLGDNLVGVKDEIEDIFG